MMLSTTCVVLAVLGVLVALVVADCRATYRRLPPQARREVRTGWGHAWMYYGIDDE
jgi:hypothetical protein